MGPKTSIDQATEVQRILEILHKWGIHTLGQLADLDRDDLGLRLGPIAVHLWERANGKCTRLLKLVPPVESFAETFEFENEIETSEPLALHSAPIFRANIVASRGTLFRRQRTQSANHF